MSRLVLVFGAVALLGVAGCGKDPASAAKMPPAAGPDAAPRPALPALQVDAAEPDRTVEANASATTGTTYPSEEAQVGPKMSGIIVDIAVDEGTVVKKGQLLFRMDTADIALRVDQARVGLKGAEVQHRATKVEYDRMQRLVEQNAVDRAQWDRIQAQYEGTQVAVEQAKVGLAMAEQALRDAVVRSPLDGVVTRKLKNEGEMATMMPPTVVLVVEDHTPLELRFRLPERALAQMKPGDEVTAEFTAVNVTRKAKVRRVDPNVDPRTRTVEVVADVDNDDGALKPGMLAEIELGK